MKRSIDKNKVFEVEIFVNIRCLFVVHVSFSRCWMKLTIEKKISNIKADLIIIFFSCKLQNRNKEKTSLRISGNNLFRMDTKKRITGSFWYGSYDTEHFHTTRAVTQDECWNMKQSQNCAGNKIIKNDKTYSFVQELVGEGSWNRIKEYQLFSPRDNPTTGRAKWTFSIQVRIS